MDWELTIVVTHNPIQDYEIKEKEKEISGV